MRRPTAGAALLLAFVLVGTVVVGAAGVADAAADDCQAVGGERVCIAAFNVSDETLLVGERANVTLTVTNPTDANATADVMLYTATSAANNTSVYRLDTLTLAGGESHTYTREINGSTVGTHGLRAAVRDPETLTRYDTSVIRTVEVRATPAPGLGGPIDRMEVALGALLVALAGMVGTGYYHLRRR